MVARFFLAQTYQNGKNVPNDHKLYQTAKIYIPNGRKIFHIKYANIFHSHAIQILPKNGIYSLQINHLAILFQTLLSISKRQGRHEKLPINCGCRNRNNKESKQILVVTSSEVC
jgi:hypothetical protein